MHLCVLQQIFFCTAPQKYVYKICIILQMKFISVTIEWHKQLYNSQLVALLQHWDYKPTSRDMQYTYTKVLCSVSYTHLTTDRES